MIYLQGVFFWPPLFPSLNSISTGQVANQNDAARVQKNSTLIWCGRMSWKSTVCTTLLDSNSTCVAPMRYAAHCRVGSMRQRGEWSRLAVGQCVTVTNITCFQHTASVKHAMSLSAAAALSKTLSSCHGSSLTRGTCCRSQCILPTASSHFFVPETGTWRRAPALPNPAADTIQTTRRADPALGRQNLSKV